MRTNAFRPLTAVPATDGDGLLPTKAKHNTSIRKVRLRAGGAIILAAAGMALAPMAAAFAEDSDELPPGAPIIRDSDRGYVNAGPAAVIVYAGRGIAYSDGDDVSAGAPILIHDGNLASPCYSGGRFDSRCGWGG